MQKSFVAQSFGAQRDRVLGSKKQLNLNKAIIFMTQDSESEGILSPEQKQPATGYLRLKKSRANNPSP